jgi:hypothetical protein
MMCRYGVALAIGVFCAAMLTRGIGISAGQAGAAASPFSGSGETRTPLGEGRWLVVGGQGGAGPVATASVVDTSGSIVPLPALHDARAWHTATILADGSVLIAGGLAADRQPLASAERFDPATETWTRVTMPAAAARAGHTATLLTDGRVLVAGGLAPDGASMAELWNLETNEATAVSGMDHRAGHSASLLADGRVALIGGTDGAQRVETVRVFDPRSTTISPLVAPLPDDGGVLRISESHPANGAEDVRLNARLTLRFSHGVRQETLGEPNVALAGPGGVAATRVIAAEDGRLVFVWPLNPLEPSATYTLTLIGVSDWAGVPLPPVSRSRRCHRRR